MTNHTHLLLRAEELPLLSQFGHFVQRRYAYYYCKTYKWSEQLFRGRFVSLPIEKDTYLLECGRYIERNPLKTNLVQDLKDYSHSSYHFYAYDKPDGLITRTPLFTELAQTQKERAAAYRFYVTQARETEMKMKSSFGF